MSQAYLRGRKARNRIAHLFTTSINHGGQRRSKCHHELYKGRKLRHTAFSEFSFGSPDKASKLEKEEWERFPLARYRSNEPSAVAPGVQEAERTEPSPLKRFSKFSLLLFHLAHPSLRWELPLSIFLFSRLFTDYRADCEHDSDIHVVEAAYSDTIRTDRKCRYVHGLGTRKGLYKCTQGMSLP